MKVIEKTRQQIEEEGIPLWPDMIYTWDSDNVLHFGSKVITTNKYVLFIRKKFEFKSLDELNNNLGKCTTQVLGEVTKIVDSFYRIPEIWINQDYTIVVEKLVD